jgi:hypothetical protein
MAAIEDPETLAGKSTLSLPLGLEPAIPSALRERLCNMCRELDFRKIKSDLRNKKHTELIIGNIDCNRDRLLSSPCPLCQFMGVILPLDPMVVGGVSYPDDRLTASSAISWFRH